MGKLVNEATLNSKEVIQGENAESFMKMAMVQVLYEELFHLIPKDQPKTKAGMDVLSESLGKAAGKKAALMALDCMHLVVANVVEDRKNGITKPESCFQLDITAPVQNAVANVEVFEKSSNGFYRNKIEDRLVQITAIPEFVHHVLKTNGKGVEEFSFNPEKDSALFVSGLKFTLKKVSLWGVGDA